MKDEKFDETLDTQEDFDRVEEGNTAELDEEVMLREIEEYNELKEGPEDGVMPTDEPDSDGGEDDEIEYGVDTDGEVILPDEDEEILDEVGEGLLAEDEIDELELDGAIEILEDTEEA